MENWKDIIGFEGLYQVSDKGRIRSLIRNKYLQTKGYPYVQVCLTKDKKHYYFLLHRLVWENFNGEIPDGMQINHKDENKENNSIFNLEICSASYNINYGNRNKIVSSKMKGVKPSKKATQRSAELFSQKVCQYKDGKLVGEYCSMMEAERKTSIRSGNISKCCNGKAKTANGYMWLRKPL